MCAECRWEEFVEQVVLLLEDVDALPEKADEFAMGVRDRLEGMSKWAEDNTHVTPAMRAATENIGNGVGRWER